MMVSSMNSSRASLYFFFLFKKIKEKKKRERKMDVDAREMVINPTTGASDHQLLGWRERKKTFEGNNGDI